MPKTITAATAATGALALAGALAFTACEAPFPQTAHDGWTASLQWVDVPAPATTYIDSADGNGGAVEVLRNRTFPSARACHRMNPAVLEHFCDTYYQGSGIVVRVPDACQKAALTPPIAAPVPDVQIDIAGVNSSAPAVVKPSEGQYGAQTHNAFWFTVSGPGVLTTGMRVFAEGGRLFDFAVNPTPRLPDRERYDVALTCATGPRNDAPGQWQLITYKGTIPKGGLPGPV